MELSAGLHLGGAEAQDPDKLLENAVELAKNADSVIAIVGLNSHWYESVFNHYFCLF
jgi:beta-glucosidase